MVAYCGEIIMIIHYHSSYVYKIKQLELLHDVPLRDHITPHYVHLGLLKFRDIVKIYNCLFLYDYVSDNKPSNYRGPAEGWHRS